MPLVERWEIVASRSSGFRGGGLFNMLPPPPLPLDMLRSMSIGTIDVWVVDVVAMNQLCS